MVCQVCYFWTKKVTSFIYIDFLFQFYFISWYSVAIWKLYNRIRNKYILEFYFYYHLIVCHIAACMTCTFWSFKLQSNSFLILIFSSRLKLILLKCTFILLSIRWTQCKFTSLILQSFLIKFNIGASWISKKFIH